MADVSTSEVHAMKVGGCFFQEFLVALFSSVMERSYEYLTR
jgi:hypothetical protein